MTWALWSDGDADCGQACAPSLGRGSLPPDQQLMAEPGRALVRRTHQQGPVRLKLSPEANYGCVVVGGRLRVR